MDNQLKIKILKRIQLDAWFFIKNYVWTLDEHDMTNPAKKFPVKPYLEATTEIWLRERLIVVEKSRQMMLSWLMVALHYWLAAYHSGQNVLVQSKKEDDSDLLIDRMWFIHQRVPEELRVPLDGGRKTYCSMIFSGTNSKIQGISQNPESARSQTTSAILSDETAFQDQAADAWRAVKASLGQTGKYTAISTPNFKEFFYKLVYDMQ